MSSGSNSCVPSAVALQAGSFAGRHRDSLSGRFLYCLLLFTCLAESVLNLGNVGAGQSFRRRQMLKRESRRINNIVSCDEAPEGSGFLTRKRSAVRVCTGPPTLQI